MNRKKYAGVHGLLRAPHGGHPPTGTFGGHTRRRGKALRCAQCAPRTPSPSGVSFPFFNGTLSGDGYFWSRIKPAQTSQHDGANG